MGIDANILEVIGNTSMVRLRRVVPPGCGQVFVKLEWEKPTGSMKDRAAQRPRPDASIATLMVDSGLKYLSTDV